MQTHQEVISKGVNNGISGSGGSLTSPASYNLIFLTAALVSTTSILFVIILKRRIAMTKQLLVGSQKHM